MTCGRRRSAVSWDKGFAPSVGVEEVVVAGGEQVAVGAVLGTRRQPQRGAVELAQGGSQGIVGLCEQALGGAHAVVRVDADQVGLEGGAVELAEQQAVGGNAGFDALAVEVEDAEQAAGAPAVGGGPVAAFAGDGAALAVGVDDLFAEAGAAQAALGGDEPGAALGGEHGAIAAGQPEGEADLPVFAGVGQPIDDPDGHEGVVEARSNGEEVDHGDFQIARGEEVLVQRVIGAALHEFVSDFSVARDNLIVREGLVVVDRIALEPCGAQREQMGHRSDLADALLAADERDVFALEGEAGVELVAGQSAVGAAEPLNVGEGGEAHALFAFVHRRPPSLRTIAAA